MKVLSRLQIYFKARKNEIKIDYRKHNNLHKDSSLKKERRKA